MNVESKWWDKVHSTYPNKPVILVATKIDLRANKEIKRQLESKGLKIISRDEGLALAEKIGAVEYHECSSLTSEGVQGLVDSAVRVGLNYKKQSEKKTCCVL
jgi:GTPase SAR1 family protein